MCCKKSAFLTGLLIGGVIGLLAAPKSGKELREDIGEHSIRLCEKTYDLKGVAFEKGKELVNDVSVKTSELVDQVKSLTKNKEEQPEETTH